MSEHKLQSGYIECLEKTHIFTYDGELLQLVPKDKETIKPYDCFVNKNKEFEVLEGINIRFEKIFFLNCHLKVSSSGYIAKPAGYICFNNGERRFNTITFKGGIIDLFYRPNHIVDKENTQYNYNTGGGSLCLKTFDETSKHCNLMVAGKKATLTLSVTLPGEPMQMQLNYNLGKPQSIFRLEFDEEVDVSEFVSIYMWIYNLMFFLNFRKDISLGKIELGLLNDEKRIEKVSDVYLNEKDKKEASNVEKIIGYYFVFEHLNELLQIINTGTLNLLFIPDSEKEGNYVSADKYMICCTSFESVFNFVFPNAKAEFNEKHNEVKAEFLKYISDKREEYKGKDSKKRKLFQKYADIIEFLDFSLVEKFNYCACRYAAIVSDYSNQLIKRYNLPQEQLDDIAQYFAHKRNELVHSSLGDFENIHIFAYLLARRFIYIMILDNANIEKEKMIQAIDKVL